MGLPQVTKKIIQSPRDTTTPSPGIITRTEADLSSFEKSYAGKVLINGWRPQGEILKFEVPRAPENCLSLVTRKLLKFLLFCRQNLIFKWKLE